MKRLKLEIMLNAPDNFEPGKCTTCPIVIKTYEEVRYGAGEYSYRCPIGCSSIICPIREEDRVYKPQDRKIETSEPITHAHWTINSNGIRICSNCKNVPQGKELKPWSKYCCHCGAKMDESEE